MNEIRAEIIAIGDELTGGVRLNTNSQWLSNAIENLGISVAFHSTVGDDLEDIASVFETAVHRTDVVLVTGGLGPTADDLTRQAMASLAQVDLVLDHDVLEHIKKMFSSRSREMPPNNEIQAWFPNGSQIIPNPEGTAPGIEQMFLRQGKSVVMFALPGVPAEMKQMWVGTVEGKLRSMFGVQQTTHHHLIHCFGTGESAIESMLPDLIRRGRDPLVGITASAATITLRVATKATSVESCLSKMKPTIDQIYDALGDLIYGENGQSLEDAVIAESQSQGKQLRVIDFGLHGDVARRLSAADKGSVVFRHGVVVAEAVRESNSFDSMNERLKRYMASHDPIAPDEVVVGIGPVERSTTRVDAGESFFDVFVIAGDRRHEKRVPYSGHSSWREIRAVKDVLNTLRLFLREK